jgi:ribosomal protein S18 acetylase RimI-like enzyme
MQHLLRELEEAVVDAWPAAETADLDGWLLRATGGPSRRANSVAPLEAGRELTLAQRIDQVEAWYQSRNLPPMFQVGPCAAPAELDETLASRGYEMAGAALAAVADPDELLATRSKQRTFEVSVSPTRSDAWSALGLREGRFAADADALLGVLRRLGTRCRYVLARDARGEPAASCLAITSEDRLGIYHMYTAPHARRSGAARSMLQALAKHARAEQMRELYLLVDADNVAARALYAQCGFRELYQYHYRRLPEPLTRAVTA